MSTGGRHELVHIIGVAQNPALIDKTFLSNCTLIHIGPLRESRHRQAVARSLDVPEQKIADLVKFQWIEKNHDTGEVSEGWILPPGMTKPPRQASQASQATETTQKQRSKSPLPLGAGKGKATGAAKARR